MDRERLASAQRTEGVRSDRFAMIGFKMNSAFWATLEMKLSQHNLLFGYWRSLISSNLFKDAKTLNDLRESIAILQPILVLSTCRVLA